MALFVKMHFIAAENCNVVDKIANASQLTLANLDKMADKWMAKMKAVYLLQCEMFYSTVQSESNIYINIAPRPNIWGKNLIASKK